MQGTEIRVERKRSSQVGVASVLGTGIQPPKFSIPQDMSVEVARWFVHDDPKVNKLLPAIYRRTQVQRRGSVLLDAPADEAVQQTLYSQAISPDDRGPTTTERMQRFQQEAGGIAIQSATTAMREAGVTVDRVTHLITVTCTGFYAPGFDYELITRLKLDKDVQRIQVGFMGCHAVINALRVAKALVEADASSIVLIVSVELCSLHYQYGVHPDSLIANALFADGSGALVVGTRSIDDGFEKANVELSHLDDDRVARVSATGSRLVPDSADAMSWKIGDHGFQMTLSAAVPGLIESELAGYLDEFLQQQNLSVDDISGWCVHPGGPRVLGSVEKALNLKEDQLKISREILGQNGNMSSATLVFILDSMKKRQVPLPWLLLGFGPGLEIEVALLT